MNEENLRVPQSYIKNVAIRLPETFELVNSPYPVDNFDEKDEKNKTKVKNALFIGNDENLDKFVRFLLSGNGVFLVTGYRGMGKTSFVNRVINEYNGEIRKDKSNPKLEVIRLTLAQNNPKESDILRLMTSSAYEHCTKHYKIDKIEKNHRTISRLMSLILIAFIIGAFIYTYLISTGTKKDLFNISNNPLQLCLCITLLCVWLIYIVINRNYSKKLNSPGYQRIKKLYERCYASLSQEQAQSESIGFAGKLATFLSVISEKKVRQFPIANTKEIEYELGLFLKEAKNELRFTFIFDELDKVDPAINTSVLNDDLETADKQKADNAYQLDLRNRKQAVINVIASLKNFLTSSEGNFIFIAGREMFDASLADIADRQSSVSSIFTYIFNIDSLLKTNYLNKANKDEGQNGKTTKNNASLSYFIEEYLKQMLLGPGRNEDLFDGINAYQVSVTTRASDSPVLSKRDQNPEEKAKIYFAFQNFITYLTYRSNGSPKKLIKAIQEFIVIRPIEDFNKNIVCISSEYADDAKATGSYLYFNYYNQYKIGFLSYLYRPFLIQYGRSFKLYSDNINVSTPYLVDHLIKFHPFAFSLTNLELMPEVLSTNKTPALKDHIRQIINHLASNHIRETEISLFDYKFYSRTANEIVFLSKIFEQEAAAFNFTLDESNLVKLHMRNKIRELRHIYEKFVGADAQQIYSIARINSILGDLLFFDQEYDDAIVAYADAIRPINHLKTDSMNMRDFIMLIKNKLKQGLCFEKMNSYDEALSFYTDCNQDAKNYMANKLNFGEPFHLIENPEERDQEHNYYNSSMSDALEIIAQSLLAKIIIQEKMGLEGISGPKLFIDLGSFLTMLEGVGKINGRSSLIAANVFMLTGKLAYFKNSTIGFKSYESFQSVLPKTIYKKIAILVNKYGETMEKAMSLRTPAIAFYFYLLGLEEIFQSRIPDFKLINSSATKNVIRAMMPELRKLAYNDVHYQFTGFHYGQIGSFLSNIGDSLLSMHIPKPDVAKPEGCGNMPPHKRIKNIRIMELFNFNKGEKKKRSLDELLIENKSGHTHLSDILRCYFIAAQFYIKYGRIHSACFQYRKILWILRLVISKDRSTPNEIDEFKLVLKEFLVSPLLKMISSTSEHTDSHMYQKARSKNLDNALIMNNLSNQPETREIVLLYNYILLKVGFDVKPEKLISSYHAFSSQYGRMLELDFYAKYNYQKRKDMIESGTKQLNWGITEAGDVLDYLFSMHSILRILKIYGTDFIAGRSYYAYTHYRVADFLSKIENHVFVLNDKHKLPLTEYLRLQMDILFDEKSFTSTDKNYHYQMAKAQYERTIQLHTAGKEYERMMRDMVYLEDDFNDNAYHFGAAFERFMMINKNFEQRIEKCDIAIQHDSRFNPGSYLE